jgi:hypothetical protein
MTQLFEITHKDVNQLTDYQLTDLLCRLLHLEAARFSITASGVRVSLHIDVPDGEKLGTTSMPSAFFDRSLIDT